MLAINNNGNYHALTNTAALVANTQVEMLAPAANVNGCVLLSASFGVENTTNGLPNTGFYFSSVNVALLNSMYIGIDVSSYIGVVYAVFGSLKAPIFIPAGYGIYFISSVNANAAANQECITYNLL